MTEKRLKTYERLLGYVLILVVILGIVSQLTGCGESWKEESRIVIDYRYVEAHTETWTRKTDQGVPYYVYNYIEEKYELLWLVTYQDGHTERHWEECTRFEYNNARKELGDIENGNDN